MRGLRIRPSACGQYIVSLIGDMPRVLTIAEAEAVRDIYIDKATELAKAGKLALAIHEKVGAESLQSAIREAAELRLSVSKRLERGAE